MSAIEYPYVIEAAQGNTRGYYNSQSGSMHSHPAYGNRYVNPEAAQKDLDEQRQVYKESVSIEVVLYKDAINFYNQTN